MKKTLLFSLLLLSCSVCFGQAKGNENDQIFQTAEVMPQFPGGDAALSKWIHETMQYPEYAKNHRISGTVLVSFVVNKDGSVVEPKILKSVDPFIDKEALRIINVMPKWVPGEHQGTTVRVRYQLPIRFVIK